MGPLLIQSSSPDCQVILDCGNYHLECGCTNNRHALLLTDGIAVTEHKLLPGPNGVPVLSARKFMHHVILTDVAADTLASRVFSKAVSHTARAAGLGYRPMRCKPGRSGHGM